MTSKFIILLYLSGGLNIQGTVRPEHSRGRQHVFVGRLTARGTCSEREGGHCERIPSPHYAGLWTKYPLVPVSHWRGDPCSCHRRHCGVAGTFRLHTTPHPRRFYPPLAGLVCRLESKHIPLVCEQNLFIVII